MDEDQHQRRARDYLESLGYSVDPIDVEPDRRRADYFVAGFGDNYLVEVKKRVRDEAYHYSLGTQGEAYREEPLGRSNAISAQVEDAARQLEDTPADEAAIRIVTFVAVGDDPQTQAARFEATVFGKVDLLQDGGGGTARATPCLYFEFNDFFRYRRIDAALILVPGASRLCVNTFARPNMVRATHLYRLHDQQGALADPEKLEQEGAVYVADTSLDRRVERDVLDYVRQKYDLVGPLLTFRPKKATAAVIVPESDGPVGGLHGRTHH